MLTGKTRLSEARRQVADNLWVVGSTLDLAAADLELAGVVGREMILRDKLKAEEQPFDYLLVDCPPSLGVLTLNALVAVDEVFIPLQPHFLALHGLSKLLETINLVSLRLNPRLKISGVVLCMYNVNTRLAGEVSDNVEQFFRSARDKNTPCPGPTPSRPASAAMCDWPRRRASGSRSSSTRPTRTAPRTIAVWPKRSRRPVRAGPIPPTSRLVQADSTWRRTGLRARHGRHARNSRAFPYVLHGWHTDRAPAADRTSPSFYAAFIACNAGFFRICRDDSTIATDGLCASRRRQRLMRRQIGK